MRPELLQAMVDSALDAVLHASGRPPLRVGSVVRRSREPTAGDWSSTIALAAGSRTGLSALELAEAVAGMLRSHEEIASCAVAHPGFIQIELTVSARSAIVAEILATGAQFVSAVPPARFGLRSNAAVPALIGYAHARSLAIVRTAASVGIGDEFDPASLDSASEIVVLNELAGFPALVARAVTVGEPGRILAGMSAVASTLRTTMAASPAIPVIGEAITTTHSSRSALLSAAAEVLRTGLEIVGHRAPERM